MAVMRIGAGVAFFDAINVKDQGATGDGATNDGPAIQAAFDLAFGPAGSAHGTAGRFLNKPVYFPAGNYSVGNPLYLNRVVGGHIFGDGPSSTKVFYSGSSSAGNILNPGNGITPLIMCDGFQYSILEGMNLDCGSSTGSKVCFHLWGNISCNANRFSNLAIGGGTTGFLAGFNSPSTAVSECLYDNVTFANCGFAGFRTVGSNTLNHWIVGGGAFGCGNGGLGVGSAAYSCASGSMYIKGGGNAGNLLDIYTNSAIPIVIQEVRSESVQFMSLNTTSATVIGCVHDTSAGTSFASIGSSATAIFDGCVSNGPSDVISGAAGGKIYLRGCGFTNANFIAAYGGTVAQNI